MSIVGPDQSRNPFTGENIVLLDPMTREKLRHRVPVNIPNSMKF